MKMLLVIDIPEVLHACYLWDSPAVPRTGELFDLGGGDDLHVTEVLWYVKTAPKIRLDFVELDYRNRELSKSDREELIRFVKILLEEQWTILHSETADFLISS